MHRSPSSRLLPAPAGAGELALRIGSARTVHEQREAGLSALLDTARELAAEPDPGQVLDEIVRRARTLVRTDLAYLTLYDPEAGDTYMRATDGSVSAAFQSVRLALGAGLGGLVASTRKPYWTADYWSDARFEHTGAIDGAVGEEGIMAICGTPLLVDSHFVGVLFAANRTPRPFTREEVALLGNLATLAAVTLVQTRTLADARPRWPRCPGPTTTVRQYAAGVEKAAAAHDRFASLVLDGGGIDDITHALAELLGGWAVVVDDTGARRSVAGDGSEPVGAGRPRRPPRPGRRSARRARRRATACAITAARERLGTIRVGGVGVLTESDQRTVERAGVVTALVLLFERNAADTRQSARNQVVTDLVVGRGTPGDQVERARTAGLDPRAPFCLLVLRGGDPSAHRALVLSASTATGEGALVGEPRRGRRRPRPAAPTRTPSPKEVAARLGRRGGVTVAGVGPVAGVTGIRSAHQEGVRTVGALIALGHRGQGAAATRLGFAGLIVGSDPDVATTSERLLGPLSDYDDRRGTDLVGTLAAYFAAGVEPSPCRRGAARPRQHRVATARADRCPPRRGLAVTRAGPRAPARAPPTPPPAPRLTREKVGTRHPSSGTFARDATIVRPEVPTRGGG